MMFDEDSEKMKKIIKLIINVHRSFPIWYCGMRLNHLRQKTKKENGVELVFQCFKFISTNANGDNLWGDDGSVNLIHSLLDSDIS